MTAKEMLINEPDRAFREFKRDMGTKTKYRVDRKSYLPDNSDGTEKVIAPKTYELSKEQYVYNGKVKTPEVRIYGKHGDQLPDTAFTVKKASGRKNVGTYTYKITFRGAYKKYGIKTLTFEILPKGTNLTKSAGRKRH